MQQIPT